MSVNERQFTGDMDRDLELWLGEAFSSWLPGARKLEIITHAGLVVVNPGEWITRDGDGFRVIRN